jgi:hypothetical protein
MFWGREEEKEMLGIVLVHTCNSHISDAEAG